MFQMKEQKKSPKKELNEMEVNATRQNLKQWLLMELTENFNKEIVSIKRIQKCHPANNPSEMKNTI